MPFEAVAEFHPSRGNILSGYVRFFQMRPDGEVRVDIDIVGPVKDGDHGIHVHQKPAKCLLRKGPKNCCALLGGHFNGEGVLWNLDAEYGTRHGSYRYNTERHIGDLCNNITFKNGRARKTFYDHLISLVPRHPNNIINRSIVIHKDRDDEGMGENIESLITGSSGSRIDCATIVIFE